MSRGGRGRVGRGRQTSTQSPRSNAFEDGWETGAAPGWGGQGASADLDDLAHFKFENGRELLGHAEHVLEQVALPAGQRE